MAWTELGFGKYSDKTLPQVLFNDPDWFFWAFEKKAFDNKGSLLMEATNIYNKATKIKIPEKWGENQVVEYTIHPSVGKFAKAEIVPIDQPRHEGSSPTFRSEFFDLSVPRQIAKYDKSGCKSLIGDIKFYVLGDANIKITKRVAENFFSNPDNFK
jgi:hypothetical protein